MNGIVKKLYASLVVFGVGMIVAGNLFANDYMVEDDIYIVAVHEKAHKKGRLVQFQIQPKNGVHCNLEYPWKLQLDTNLKLTKRTQKTWRKTDATTFTEELVAFSTHIFPAKNTKQLVFELKLSMCNATQCFMKKVPIEIAIK